MMTISTEHPIHHPTTSGLRYPATEQRSQSEVWHGTEVVDQYVWLEEDGPEVRAWEQQQNQLTRRYLDSIDDRAAIKDSLKKWFDLDQAGCPFPRGTKLFQWKRK